ncbi:MAG: hypothetical protein HQ559_13660 [Lentisphaerae bacterium]|nr:hypothetical protein [Lentisphaerota bacterium]
MSHITTCMVAGPRLNLGPRWTTANDEDRFADAFAEAYDSRYPWLHSGSPKLNRVMAREVPVNGFGIADLVTVSWDIESDTWQTDPLSAELRPTVRAFEFKLSNWRKGLMQAHRYRFFADVAMLVLPTSKLAVAEPFHATFQAINVGLWGFNPVSGTISTVLTPRPRMPTDRGHRDKVIQRVLDTARQALPSP